MPVSKDDLRPQALANFPPSPLSDAAIRNLFVPLDEVALTERVYKRFEAAGLLERWRRVESVARKRRFVDWQAGGRLGDVATIAKEQLLAIPGLGPASLEGLRQQLRGEFGLDIGLIIPGWPVDVAGLAALSRRQLRLYDVRALRRVLGIPSSEDVS